MPGDHLYVHICKTPKIPIKPPVIMFNMHALLRDGQMLRSCPVFAMQKSAKIAKASEEGDREDASLDRAIARYFNHTLQSLHMPWPVFSPADINL